MKFNEQVVANEERTNPSNDTKSNSTTPKLHTISPEISQHFSDLIMNLPLSQREKEVLKLRLYPYNLV